MWIFADEKIAAWIAASEKGGFSHRIPTKFLLYLLNVFEKIPKKTPPVLVFSKIILTFALHLTKNEVGEIKFEIGEMAEWSNAAVLKTVDLNGSGGSNPSLSAELTGQKWSVNGQKATNQRFVAFFIARKSCFQDFKSTVKDKVSLLNRYLFPAGQKR